MIKIIFGTMRTKQKRSVIKEKKSIDLETKEKLYLFHYWLETNYSFGPMYLLSDMFNSFVLLLVFSSARNSSVTCRYRSHPLEASSILCSSLSSIYTKLNVDFIEIEIIWRLHLHLFMNKNRYILVKILEKRSICPYWYRIMANQRLTTGALLVSFFMVLELDFYRISTFLALSAG